MRITKEAVLGFLFLAGLTGLALTTIALTEVTLSRRPRLPVYFPEAKFLKKGDPVYVAGVRSGRVKEVRYDPQARLDKRVRVTVELDHPVALRRDYAVEIAESTLLGGRVIAIEPGRFDQPPIGEGDELFGHARAEHLAALNALIEENQQDIRRFIASIATSAEMFERGNGTIARLLRDDAPFREVTAAAKELRAAIEDARAGKGSLGKLLSDDSLYADAKDIAARTRSLIARVEAGEGTLGELITRRDALDRANKFFERAESAADSFSRIVSRVEGGEGTLGRLLTDHALYDAWVKVGDDVSAIASAIREGKGTIGRLFTDEDLLADLRTALKSISRQIEDAREAAPIATFAGVLFGVL
ncbi:MAG TPA: MlaD family protein [Planctomycetota bacterium]|jgi:phospholipid/cholesterol/gamma-HCH transport system substrate-binding protein|nr:MlaD family protein [Planctomycetota bacterium]